MVRNTQLHGTSPEEEKKIQRIRAIQLACQRYEEGNKAGRTRFLVLYRETIRTICDKSTLHILKWTETYEVCRGTIQRDNTIIGRWLIEQTGKAYLQLNTIANIVNTTDLLPALHPTN